jgi:hypothetical protein
MYSILISLVDHKPNSSRDTLMSLLGCCDNKFRSATPGIAHLMSQYRTNFHAYTTRTAREVGTVVPDGSSILASISGPCNVLCREKMTGLCKSVYNILV